MIIFFPSATIDVKRNIFDLCTDTKDCYLAVIEVILMIQNHLVFFFFFKAQYDAVDLSFFPVCLVEPGFCQQRYSLSAVRSGPPETCRGRGG